MLISHHQEDIGDFHICDLDLTPKRLFKVLGHDVNGEQFLPIGTLGLGATVETIRNIFTFVTLKRSRQGHPRSNFVRILKDRYQLPNSVS